MYHINYIQMVSLISSSLFRAASTMGKELPEIPQISLAMANEERKKVENKPKGLFQGIKTPEKTASATNFDNMASKTQKVIKMFSDTTPSNLSNNSDIFDEESKNNSKKIDSQSNKKKDMLKTSLSEREEALDKIAKGFVKGPTTTENNDVFGEKQLTASTLNQKNTKVSLDEKEAKLDSLHPNFSLKGQTSTENKISLENLKQQKADKSAEDEDQEIMTNNPINQLLQLIKEKHSVTTSQAAQALNVSKELIDTWAKILSQSSLIRIKYQLMGDTILEG
ncbi:MAG: hypothetical protein BJBARM5_0022 [Candidatus Parvarchaeum acidophilus ARMAN-5]|uniref:Uncharacterized protein n=1 Tax=Candidatus Parvarchaeum acidophilus ARMAN-5 TaxID=662762 RepID=D6GU99_PARA5|nr:MAG: hypothetical protein BJBARM5_0022 [Candidatus Parvarchaeum acidophilus ARMAN-5]